MVRPRFAGLVDIAEGLLIEEAASRNESRTSVARGAPSDAELTQRGVSYRGARIGFIRERVTPLESGYRVEQTGELTITVLGRERRMRIEGSTETGADGKLREFSFR